MESTLMKERLEEALLNKKADINSFVWKEERILDDTGRYKQREKKMSSMSEQELRNCYEKAKAMLFNKDSKNPGRYVILEEIAEQKDRCGAELFLRYVDQKHGLTRFVLLNSINEFLKNNRESLKNTKPEIGLVFSSIPAEFEKISLSLIIDGCLDRLGTLNKKHITRALVLRQGIWLTPTESKDLVELDSKGNPRDRLEVIRERLGIKDIEKLYINSKGLNYTQVRAMLNIKSDKKYMDLTTTQLETLRYRILFNLEEEIKKHIDTWERLMGELELVAEHKGFSLND